MQIVDNMLAIFSLINLIWIIDSVTVNDIPFSWNHIPVWSFPGFSNHFLTETEIYNPNNSFSNFSFMLLTIFNASCLLPNGTYYGATTTDWWYECSSDPGNIKNYTIDQYMYPNAEQSISYQSMQLKTKYLHSKTHSIILSYIESINSQISYVKQKHFNAANMSSYWLWIQNMGYINCMRPNATEPMGCDYQGPSEHQYDHRQKIVRQYFINNVLNGILFEYKYSKFLDGVFLDTISAWIEPYALCHNWNCTQLEYEQLWNASLLLLDESLEYLQSVSKLGSVSIRGDMFDMREYYLQFIEIVMKYKYTSAIRYYEEMTNTGSGTLYNRMITIMNEIKYNISIQTHQLWGTYAPDFVELAGYLIVASEHTWFSHSNGGWGVNDSWWINEFDKPLGEPLENAVCNYTFFGYDQIKNWKLTYNLSVVISQPKLIPGQDDNIYGIRYIGMANSLQNCGEKVSVYAQQNNFTSFTYYGNFIDSKGGNWTSMCYAKVGVIIDEEYSSKENKIGWFVRKQINATTANIFDFYCKREFEYLRVNVNPISFDANLQWK